MSETVQDMLQNLFEEDTQDSNETLELMKFIKQEGTPFTTSQIKGMLLLSQYEETKDLVKPVVQFKQHVTPSKLYFDLIGKLTLADRIKGSAKLSHLMKATSNPAQTLKPEEVQAKGFSKKEIEGR